jgi:hypothetical protein
VTVIGVDFDNTIVCYDGIFHRAAVERGLIPPDAPADKTQIRGRLRARGREHDWTELQGYVYGALMAEAPAFQGVEEFFIRCRERGVKTHIISHRTARPYAGPEYDLHAAARDWLCNRGFHDPNRINLDPNHVFFETTKQLKLERIAAAGCTHFIDDLPEFLSGPGFPPGVVRILFDPRNAAPRMPGIVPATSWLEMDSHVF